MHNERYFAILHNHSASMPFVSMKLQSLSDLIVSLINLLCTQHLAVQHHPNLHPNLHPLPLLWSACLRNVWESHRRQPLQGDRTPPLLP